MNANATTWDAAAGPERLGQRRCTNVRHVIGLRATIAPQIT